MIKNPFASQSCPNGSFRSNCPRGIKCLYFHPGDDKAGTGPPKQVSTAITVPERRSRRKKHTNKRYVNADEMAEEPKVSPLCVKCNIYVDSGPFCIECQRWWHYKCAQTTKKAVNKLIGVDFVCQEHDQADSFEINNTGAAIPSSIDVETTVANTDTLLGDVTLEHEATQSEMNATGICINSPSPINVNTPVANTDMVVVGDVTFMTLEQSLGLSEKQEILFETNDITQYEESFVQEEAISQDLNELNGVIEKKNSIIMELEAELEREKENYKIKMENLIKENKDLKEREGKFKESDSVKCLREKVNTEKARVAQLGKDVIAKDKTISNLGIQVNKLQTSNTQLKQKNESLEERIEVLKATNESLQDAVKLREDELCVYKRKLAEHEQLVVSDRDVFDEIDKKCRELEIERDDLVNRIRSLEAEVTSVQAEKKTGRKSKLHCDE